MSVILKASAFLPSFKSKYKLHGFAGFKRTSMMRYNPEYLRFLVLCELQYLTKFSSLLPKCW